MAENKTKVEEAPVAEPTVETKTILNFDNLQKLDHAGVVAACIASKQYENNAAMKVSNITLRTLDELDEDGKVIKRDKARDNMTIVVNRPLPAYMINNFGQREFTTSKNVFVAAFQIASVLKATGETAFANKVLASPSAACAILEGARVSVLTRHYAAGEVELNPFSNKESEYAFENDTVKHYLYDITLGETGMSVKREMIKLLAAQMIG